MSKIQRISKHHNLNGANEFGAVKIPGMVVRDDSKKTDELKHRTPYVMLHGEIPLLLLPIPITIAMMRKLRYDAECASRM